MVDKKERPILFSGPMVRAVLRDVDPKTQTRRLVKDQKAQPDGMTRFEIGHGHYWHANDAAMLEGYVERLRCPYGAPGDRLWVRETCILPVFDDDPDQVVYAADHAVPEIARAEIQEGADGDVRWRPSIHMPRWASRIDLEVTAVRVERLQDITEEDARAEGVCRENVPAMLPSIAVLAAQAREVIHGTGHTSADPTVWPVARDYRDLFMLAWTAINGERAAWGSNPWVWVVSFKRVAP